MCVTTVAMPKFEAIPIPTRGKKWYKQLWIMLTQSRRIRISHDYLIYVPNIQTVILIPKGFECDLASIPRLFWFLIPPDGIFMIGGIVHDFYYKYHCFLDVNRRIIFAGKGRLFGDNVFKVVNVIVNDMPIITGIGTDFLNIGGAFAWNKHRKINSDVTVDFKGIIAI